MEETLFTKIIRGEIPSHKIYEDDKTYAFLDIEPIQPGHVLVVPKYPAATLWELDSADYLAVMETVRKVALRTKEVLKTEYVGMKLEGTQVPHAHVHVVPFNSVEEFHALPSTIFDNETLASLAKRLAI